MIKLARYLKPYIIPLLICFGLLYGQANAELALPDYMSRIVNVGLVQGGVEDAALEAIRETQMEKLLIFLSVEEKELVLGAYVKAEPSEADENTKYPLLASEPLYLRRSLNSGEKAELEPVMSRALAIVYGIEQMQNNPELAASSGSALGFGELPPGTDVFRILGSLPPEQLEEIKESFTGMMESAGGTMVSAYAAAAAGEEYEAIGMDMEKIQRDYIIRVGMMMLGISLFGALCAVLVGVLSARTAAGAAMSMRGDIFRKTQYFSHNEFDKFSTASLITRSTNDVTQMQTVIVMLVRMAVYAPIMGAGGVVRALGKSVAMSWIIALAVIVMLGVMSLVVIIVMPKFRKIQTLVDKLNLVTRENLSGMMVIRAYNAQRFEEARFDKANSDLAKTSRFVNRSFSLVMPIMMLMMNAISLLVVWVGAKQIEASSLMIGDMMAFMQYTIQIVMSFLMLSMILIMLPRASVSGKRISEVLDSESAVRDPAVPGDFLPSERGVVRFENVSFAFPGAEEPTLRDISFTAEPGKTTAFIGPTGSGKSTLVNLIERFYDVTEGRVTVSGADVREVSQERLREEIGYAPQKAMLFSGTIAENIGYADKNATTERVREAISVAQADNFVFGGPEGLERGIAQAGANISGGQKQRLSIARALVKKPPVYIFDDTFSALDFKTDAALRKALREYTGESSVLIVAQRVGTIMHADQIIVMDEGRIVGRGTHEELMESCGVYRDIALSQLQDKEGEL